MTDPWLARIAGKAMLLAPNSRDQVEASLAGLDEKLMAELGKSRADAAGDDFWTELGSYGSRVLRPYSVRNGILQIAIRGVLLSGFPYQYFSYATGYEYIGKALDRGLADADVKGIALVIESPGGMVSGNFDLVDRIYVGRAVKPIAAFASEYAFSAAYSIASAAQTITVPRTGELGSIGVVLTHLDVSQALEEAGLKFTYIFAGKHKVDGTPFAPLPDEVKAAWQEDIDYTYGIFVDTVARNRGMTPEDVRATEADTFRADEAVEIGLADKIGALVDALAEFEADVLNPDEGDETMSDNKPALTVASVKADHPEVANALIAEGREAGKAEAKTDFDTQMTAERARVAGLDKLASQMGNSASAATIITAAKADGSSVADTSLKLIEAGAHKAGAAGDALRTDEETARAAAPAAPGGTAATPQTPEGWKAEYAADAKLQGEFPSAEAYVAHKRDEAKKGGSK